MKEGCSCRVWSAPRARQGGVVGRKVGTPPGGPFLWSQEGPRGWNHPPRRAADTSNARVYTPRSRSNTPPYLHISQLARCTSSHSPQLTVEIQRYTSNFTVTYTPLLMDTCHKPDSQFADIHPNTHKHATYTPNSDTLYIIKPKDKHTPSQTNPFGSPTS